MDKNQRQAELMKLTKSQLIDLLELVDKHHKEQLEESILETAKAQLFSATTAGRKGVKPRKVRNLSTDTEEVTLGLCGNCESTKYLDSYDNYCPRCGAKIDW